MTRPAETELSTLAIWLGYLRRYRPYRWTLIASAGLSVLQSLLLVPVAWFIKLSFDRILGKAGLWELLLPCGAILVLVASSSMVSLLARHHSLRITKRVVYGLRHELLAKAYQLAGTFSSASDRSALHTTIVQDTERVDVGSNAIVVVCIPALVTSAIFTLALAVLAPVLLLATLLAVPLAVASNRLIGRRLRKLVEGFRRDFQNFDENIFAALRRIELTRLSGAEQLEMTRQNEFMDRLRRTSGRMAWMATAYSTAQSGVITVAIVVTLIAGGTAVAQGWMSISALAAYSFVLAQLGSSANALAGAAQQVLAGTDSLGNVARMLAAARRTPIAGARKHNVQGAVELRDVHFSYGTKPLFEGLNLLVPAGGRIAIIGPNGSGKTTLAHLLLGIYMPERGEVLVDGEPVGELALDHYRRQVGVALQDPMIFAGTVSANIAYGRPDASPGDIVRAAELAGADDFIRAMPDGYDTMIGQGGVSPSGGQSQMLSLTRALLGLPKLLILDEPTNHLDEAATDTLLRNLGGLDCAPTVIVVTHDRKIAGKMNETYRLEAGRLSPLVAQREDRRPQIVLQQG